MRTSLRHVAPVFITDDLARASAHYRRLGFEVTDHDPSRVYAYARRDGVEIHLAEVEVVDCAANTSCAYLLVDDASALHREWAAIGIDGRLDAPTTTAYGMDEGAHVDPDGNLLRFGSPVPPTRTDA